MLIGGEVDCVRGKSEISDVTRDRSDGCRPVHGTAGYVCGIKDVVGDTGRGRPVAV